MSPIRVMLADDHALVRAGIRALLENMAGVEVVGEADDGDAALRAIAKHQPDVVLMDIAMPGLDGLSAIASVTRDWPHVRVIVLSMHAEREYVVRALRAGAKGYLLKGARTSELELAVTAVAAGDKFICPAVSNYLVDDLLHHTKGELSPFELLTPRQRQVLELIANGHARKEIAHMLNVSPKTVDTYRAQVMEQLGIRDVAGLVRFAIGQNLIHDPQNDPADGQNSS